jgi:hypothetical protein
MKIAGSRGKYFIKINGVFLSDDQENNLQDTLLK